jgi:hypothetical protein
MAVVPPLSKQLDKGFITRLQRIAGGATTAEELAKSVRSSSKDSVSISEGLRTGARLLGTAVQGISTVSSLVSITEQSLEKLEAVVEKAEVVAKSATRTGIGSEQRRRLARELDGLQRDFDKVQESAKIEDRDLLSAEELDTLLENFGIATSDDTAIGRAFRSLVTSAQASSLIPDSEITVGESTSSNNDDGQDDIDPLSLRSPEDARQLLKSLQKVRETLRDTAESVSDLRDGLSGALTFVQSVGYALLDESAAVRDDEDIASVAARLQERVRQRGGSAVFRDVQNLSTITVAALLRSAE